MDELPSPSKEDEGRFYNALGRAITDWAHVEAELYAMVASLIGCERERASIIFYRTPTIDSRLQLADDLMQTLFPRTTSGGKDHPGLRIWKDLKKAIKDELPTRNQLAHQPATPFIDIYESEDESKVELRASIASYISPAEKLRKQNLSSPILTAAAIEDHIKKVSALVQRLRVFANNEFLVRLTAPR
jgi:hypothetical protein